MVLKESYEWSVKKRYNGGGKYNYAVYINPQLSEDTYIYKDKIKGFGAKWDNNIRAWYFEIPEGQATKEKIEQIVGPCIEFLKSVEVEKGNESTTNETVDKIIKMIDNLISNISTTPSAAAAEKDTSLDPQDIKDRLKKFKEELIHSFSDGTWKQMMEPIVKFRNAQGPGFSILNSILIWVQDPEATMVKTISNWNKANRTVLPGSPKLCLWCPKGPKKFKTEAEKYQATVEFLLLNKKIKTLRPSREEVEGAKALLTVGEREKLNRYLNSLARIDTWDLPFLWYDVRYTRQMTGKEDLIGSQEGIDEIPWYDGVSKESEKSIKMYDAILKVITNSGIKITYETEEQLGGARGVSKSGTIAILQNAEKTPGTVSTLIHEYSHEMLHQKYLKDNDKEYSSFFIGTKQGRAKVEQQAEISAWIVMRNFGYDMQTAVNYAGIWGADMKTCAIVFDNVAKVATNIIEKMTKEMSAEQQVNEGADVTTGITGMDVAEMLGKDAVAAYKKSLQLNAIRENFFRNLDRMKNIF